MSLTRSNGGMFGVKLVGPDFRLFDFHGKDLTVAPALMCFPDSSEGWRTASVIPIGHKSLVYLMAPVKRFWTAIEYIDGNSSIGDVLEEGRLAAIAHKDFKTLEVYAPHFAKVFRCVRILARIDDPANAPTPNFGFQKGDVSFDIDKSEYFDWFNAVPWDYQAD